MWLIKLLPTKCNRLYQAKSFPDVHWLPFSSGSNSHLEHYWVFWLDCSLPRAAFFIKPMARGIPTPMLQPCNFILGPWAHTSTYIILFQRCLVRYCLILNLLLVSFFFWYSRKGSRRRAVLLEFLVFIKIKYIQHMICYTLDNSELGNCKHVFFVPNGFFPPFFISRD